MDLRVNRIRRLVILQEGIVGRVVLVLVAVCRMVLLLAVKMLSNRNFQWVSLYFATRKLCHEYRSIFYCEGIPLSFSNSIRHKMKTTDETPALTKSYRFPEVHKKEVHVPEKLDASGIRKWRVVIDYRKLNQKTADDRYPLPNISEILDKLGRANYFTTLDLVGSKSNRKI